MRKRSCPAEKAATCQPGLGTVVARAAPVSHTVSLRRFLFNTMCFSCQRETAPTRQRSTRVRAAPTQRDSARTRLEVHADGRRNLLKRVVDEAHEEAALPHAFAQRSQCARLSYGRFIGAPESPTSSSFRVWSNSPESSMREAGKRGE